VRILADENVHKRVVVRLRDAGYSVEWVRETARGSSDDNILAGADISEHIFVTNDSDFGELIFAQGAPCPYCVLYSRLPHRLVDDMVDRLIELLQAGVPGHSIVTLTAAGNHTRLFPGVLNG
jgi:predicted nuclease of predicted toxin-antitoxin system